MNSHDGERKREERQRLPRPRKDAHVRRPVQSENLAVMGVLSSRRWGRLPTIQRLGAVPSQGHLHHMPGKRFGSARQASTVADSARVAGASAAAPAIRRQRVAGRAPRRRRRGPGRLTVPHSSTKRSPAGGRCRRTLLERPPRPISRHHVLLREVVRSSPDWTAEGGVQSHGKLLRRRGEQRPLGIAVDPPEIEPQLDVSTRRDGARYCGNTSRAPRRAMRTPTHKMTMLEAKRRSATRLPPGASRRTRHRAVGCRQSGFRRRPRRVRVVPASGPSSDSDSSPTSTRRGGEDTSGGAASATPRGRAAGRSVARGSRRRRRYGPRTARTTEAVISALSSLRGPPLQPTLVRGRRALGAGEVADVGGQSAAAANRPTLTRPPTRACTGASSRGTATRRSAYAQ